VALVTLGALSFHPYPVKHIFPCGFVVACLIIIIMGANASCNAPGAVSTTELTTALENLNKASFFSELEKFGSEIEGVLLTPAQEALYTTARTRPFNQDMRGYPLVIVQAKNTSDVVKCVNFVREHGNGIKLCICSGGHSNRCMLDNSFVIDLQLMNSASVENADTDSPIVIVEGGAYLENADKACMPHGIGMVAGSYPQTGIGGWCLAGGFGWLARMYGLGVDNLLEVEVVLATGEVVVANDSNEHRDLIVGCRGGGGNFGVVTKFTFRGHKLPKYCHGGNKVFMTPTLASAVQVCKNLEALTSEIPDNAAWLLVCPAGAPVVPTMWTHFGDEENAKVPR
jgi:FAD/FMN-containing dehydrogenase